MSYSRFLTLGDVKRKPHARGRSAHTIFRRPVVLGLWRQALRHQEISWLNAVVYVVHIAEALAVDGLSRHDGYTVSKVERARNTTIWPEAPTSQNSSGARRSGTPAWLTYV